MALILLTGANGFIGRAICEKANQRGFQVRGVTRAPYDFGSRAENVIVKSVDGRADWSHTLRGVDVVIHTAARVHVMDDKACDPLAEFRQVNVAGTLNLARQAAVAGVKRFLFVSSIKVNGEATALGRPFTANDVPAPLDAYGVSKYEAEVGLRKISADTGMEVVIVRPPLVYGSGVKANFASLMKWLARGVPLPLGAVTENRRSLVALDNLVDLLVTCIDHPAAADQTFLVSDGEDLSTAELVYRMAQAMGRPARMLPVPAAWLQWGATIIGKGNVAQRLLGSLQVDITKTCQLLSWTPPVGVDEGLRRATAGFAK